MAGRILDKCFTELPADCETGQKARKECAAVLQDF